MLSVLESLVPNNYKRQNLYFFFFLFSPWIFSVDYPVSGFMDSKAECGKKSMLSWSSTGNELFSGKELFGGEFFMNV